VVEVNGLARGAHTPNLVSPVRLTYGDLSVVSYLWGINIGASKNDGNWGNGRVKNLSPKSVPFHHRTRVQGVHQDAACSNATGGGEWWVSLLLLSSAWRLGRVQPIPAPTVARKRVPFETTFSTKSTNTTANENHNDRRRPPPAQGVPLDAACYNARLAVTLHPTPARRLIAAMGAAGLSPDAATYARRAVRSVSLAVTLLIGSRVPTQYWQNRQML